MFVTLLQQTVHWAVVRGKFGSETVLLFVVFSCFTALDEGGLG